MAAPLPTGRRGERRTVPGPVAARPQILAPPSARHACLRRRYRFVYLCSSNHIGPELRSHGVHRHRQEPPVDTPVSKPGRSRGDHRGVARDHRSLRLGYQSPAVEDQSRQRSGDQGQALRRHLRHEPRADVLPPPVLCADTDYPALIDKLDGRRKPPASDPEMRQRTFDFATSVSSSMTPEGGCSGRRNRSTSPSATR